MTSANIHEVAEGVQYQKEGEQIAHSVTTTNWVSPPANPDVTAYDETAGNTDVTATVYPANAPGVGGDIITLSLLRNLTKNHTYRVEIEFTSGGNTYVCYFRVICV